MVPYSFFLARTLLVYKFLKFKSQPKINVDAVPPVFILFANLWFLLLCKKNSVCDIDLLTCLRALNLAFLLMADLALLILAFSFYFFKQSSLF